ncbi:MAG: acyl-ACP--UDP-N-acetylglucosamine O-acyltransferase [Bacteroidales bacterium]|nr:acyl-ACP--UDP-N-acetylglucosamine O-acyltransferase [Bacteroidales bacterium]
MNTISPLAFVHPEALIGENCEIGPFCYIDRGVEIGDNNVLMNSVTLLYGTRLGNGNTIFPGAVIGAVPQDLKFQGEDTIAIIGDNNRIRENVTINRGTASKGKTVVGSNNLLMEGMHLGHDSVVGNGCIIGNSTKLAGEVHIDDFAILSANVLLHQFCRVGSYVMVGGGTRIGQDVPPFITAGREPAAYCGLNLVGLRRRGFSSEVINQVHDAYRLIYSGRSRKAALEELSAIENPIPEVKYVIDFIKTSERGIISA